MWVRNGLAPLVDLWFQPHLHFPLHAPLTFIMPSILVYYVFKLSSETMMCTCTQSGNVTADIFIIFLVISFFQVSRKNVKNRVKIYTFFKTVCKNSTKPSFMVTTKTINTMEQGAWVNYVECFKNFILAPRLNFLQYIL